MRCALEKIALLSRIRKLSTLIHSSDIAQYNLSDGAIAEIKRTLDEITEQYIHHYC